MKPFPITFAIAACSVVLIVGLNSVQAQTPLHNNLRPFQQDDPGQVPCSEILLAATSKATASDSADDTSRKFSTRTAAAIYQAACFDLTTPAVNSDDYGLAILARFAYAEYFRAPDSDLRRAEAAASLKKQNPGLTGTDGDYDFLLNLYLPLLYKYFSVAELAPVREFIISILLNVRGPMGANESEHIAQPAIGLFIPETENHLFLIETARYLTNQLVYQRTHLQLFDNRRNGFDLPGTSNTPTVSWILGALQGILQHDFLEYNAKSYQDQTMKALLNLASYAYDDDVRLGARMSLDYLSAKVAVSSNNLRRAVPFRRRNEESNTGPVIPNSSFLRSPLLIARKYQDAPDKDLTYSPDPQGPWYAMLAGNIDLLGKSVAGIHQPGNYGLGMIVAGLDDYRVPPLILDLFLNGIDRRFYQRFHHGHIIPDSLISTSADELYAGSPSYLITAGGRPEPFAYNARGLDEGLPLGQRSDLGIALPTTFMATDSNLSLDHMIQFGTRSDGFVENGVDSGDPIHTHMCVAPDFACGCSIFLPAEIDPDRHSNDPTILRDGNWTFIDRGSDGQADGYYLAVFRVDSGTNGECGLLEAYDTRLHPLSFQPISFSSFRQAVKTSNGSMNLKFGASAVNSYTTFSGSKISFTIAPASDVLSVSDQSEPNGYKEKFTHGNVLNSEQGSGVVVVRNPALQSQITLNMARMFHPTRTSESGDVESAGYTIQDGSVVSANEVWVDFNSVAPGREEGDFYRPVKGLAAAQERVVPGGTVKIVPGLKIEKIILTKPMTIRSFEGSATIRVR